MKANNAMEIYDFYVIRELQKKLNLVPNANFIFAPPELALRLAYEEFGEIIFPLYSIFRSDPVERATDGSYATFRIPYILNQEKSINQVLVQLKYSIDFWGKTMFDMNKANKNYLNFQKDKSLLFNFSEIGLPELSDDVSVEINLDKIVSNHGIENAFNIGRYFRWSYGLNLIGLELDINQEVEFNEVVFGLYSDNFNTKNLEFEEEIEIDA